MAKGCLGEGGRGAVDHFHMHGRVDVEIGTLSKAFGVVGGFVAGKEIVIIEHLRQKGRPFLFSSALHHPRTSPPAAPPSIFSNLRTIWCKSSGAIRAISRRECRRAGLIPGKSETPITPVMLGEAKTAQEFSRRLFEEGVFAMAIGFPTVPMGKARIRVMISATHSEQDLDYGVEQFC